MELIVGEQTPEEALTCLGDASYGVVVEAKGSPVALITNEDLRIAKEREANSLLDRNALLPPRILASELSSTEDIVRAWTDTFKATRCRPERAVCSPLC